MTYYGDVLTARSGLRTQEEARDLLAQTAANFEACLSKISRVTPLRITSQMA